jgi:hypothetical protein
LRVISIVDWGLVRKVQGKVNNGWIHNKLGSRSIFIIISFIVIALIVDTSIVRISTFTGGLRSTGSSITIFTCMAIIFGVGQYIILGFIRRRNSESSQNDMLWVSSINKSVSIVLYASIAIFGALILQMVFTSSYNVLWVEILVWINYVLAISILGFLSQRFLLWFKSNRNAVVLTYAVAIMMIAINAVFTLVYVTNQLIGANGSPIIQPIMNPVANTSMGGSVYDILNSAYFITSILSFILTWVATVFLLRSYYRKLGRAKYWILVSMPLVYFLSQFQTVFLDMSAPFRLSEPILFGVVYTLFFTATIPAGGILFGVAFWTMARNLGRSAVKDYMIISAYGMMLLFCSNQASGLILVPYPPFGLATVSFFGLASYLIFMGIYSSAISVAQDSELRQSIRGFAMKESRLLDSIGVAQMEQQIQKRVIVLTKQNQDRLKEASGIESSLTEEDMKQYLEQVMEEVGKKRQQPQQG